MTLYPALMLTFREILRFYRQPGRIIGALGTPLVFWAFIGSGVSDTFRSPLVPEGMGYLEFLYPGTLVMIILFTSIFSNISVIDDKSAGFLQSVLVAPVSRFGIVLGKVLGGTLLATLQSILFLALAPLSSVPLGFGNVFIVLGTTILISLCLSTLGFVFAWRLDSTQAFHSVMNLVLFPMWLLCGALFPYAGAPRFLQILMALNPLTYGLSLLRYCFYGTWDFSRFSPLMDLLILSSVTAALCTFAVFQARGEVK